VTDLGMKEINLKMYYYSSKKSFYQTIIEPFLNVRM
jgi:hypothetical protein